MICYTLKINSFLLQKNFYSVIFIHLMVFGYKRSKYQRGPLWEFLGFFIFLFFAVWVIVGSIISVALDR